VSRELEQEFCIDEGSCRRGVGQQTHKVVEVPGEVGAFVGVV